MIETGSHALLDCDFVGGGAAEVGEWLGWKDWVMEVAELHGDWLGFCNGGVGDMGEEV